MPILHKLRLEIPEREIEARLQVRRGQTVISEKMSGHYKRMLAEALALVEPAAVWEIFSLEQHPAGTISIAHSLTIQNPAVLNLLADSIQACLFAVTIGSAVSRRIMELTDSGDLVSASFLDAIASALADEAADKTEAAVRYEAHKGRPLKTDIFTRRFSPGYSGWELDVQPEILKLLDAGRLGMSTTANFILVPEKSITAIMGIRQPPDGNGF
jgi:hypothetical protein